MEKYLTPATAEWYESASDEQRAATIELGRKVALLASERGGDLQMKLELEHIHAAVAQQSQLIMSQFNQRASATRGQIGESYVYDILNGKFDVQEVGKIAKYADLIVDGKILVEVKNYTRPVPSKEVEKFARDIAARSAAGGVFISLNSRVIGKRAFTHECINCDGAATPVIYLTSAEPAVIELAVEIIVSETQRQFETFSRTRVLERVAGISEALSGLSMLRSNLRDLQGSVQRGLSESLSTAMSTQIRISELIKQIRREIIIDEEETVPAPQASNILETIERKYKIVNKELFKNIFERIPPCEVKLYKARITCGHYAFKFDTKAVIFMISAAGSSLADWIAKAIVVDQKLLKLSRGWFSLPITRNTYDLILELFPTNSPS